MFLRLRLHSGRLRKLWLSSNKYNVSSFEKSKSLFSSIGFPSQKISQTYLKKEYKPKFEIECKTLPHLRMTKPLRRVFSTSEIDSLDAKTTDLDQLDAIAFLKSKNPRAFFGDSEHEKVEEGKLERKLLKLEVKEDKLYDLKGKDLYKTIFKDITNEEFLEKPFSDLNTSNADFVCRFLEFLLEERKSSNCMRILEVFNKCVSMKRIEVDDKPVYIVINALDRLLFKYLKGFEKVDEDFLRARRRIYLFLKLVLRNNIFLNYYDFKVLISVAYNLKLKQLGLELFTKMKENVKKIEIDIYKKVIDGYPLRFESSGLWDIVEEMKETMWIDNEIIFSLWKYFSKKGNVEDCLMLLDLNSKWYPSSLLIEKWLDVFVNPRMKGSIDPKIILKGFRMILNRYCELNWKRIPNLKIFIKRMEGVGRDEDILQMIDILKENNFSMIRYEFKYLIEKVGNNCTFDQLTYLFELYKELGYKDDNFLNILLKKFSKHGSNRNIEEVLKYKKLINVSESIDSYEARVKFYFSNKDFLKVIDLWKEMKELNIKPTVLIFENVLSAFDKMNFTEDFCLEIEHNLNEENVEVWSMFSLKLGLKIFSKNNISLIKKVFVVLKDADKFSKNPSFYAEVLKYTSKFIDDDLLQIIVAALKENEIEPSPALFNAFLYDFNGTITDIKMYQPILLGVDILNSSSLTIKRLIDVLLKKNNLERIYEFISEESLQSNDYSKEKIFEKLINVYVKVYLDCSEERKSFSNLVSKFISNLEEIGFPLTDKMITICIMVYSMKREWKSAYALWEKYTNLGISFNHIRLNLKNEEETCCDSLLKVLYECKRNNELNLVFKQIQMSSLDVTLSSETVNILLKYFTIEKMHENIQFMLSYVSKHDINSNLEYYEILIGYFASEWKNPKNLQNMIALFEEMNLKGITPSTTIFSKIVRYYSLKRDFASLMNIYEIVRKLALNGTIVLNESIFYYLLWGVCHDGMDSKIFEQCLSDMETFSIKLNPGLCRIINRFYFIERDFHKLSKLYDYMVANQISVLQAGIEPISHFLDSLRYTERLSDFCDLFDMVWNEKYEKEVGSIPTEVKPSKPPARLGTDLLKYRTSVNGAKFLLDNGEYLRYSKVVNLLHFYPQHTSRGLYYILLWYCRSSKKSLENVFNMFCESKYVPDAGGYSLGINHLIKNKNFEEAKKWNQHLEIIANKKNDESLFKVFNEFKKII